MEITLATCDFCDTYFTLFLTMYCALAAVILSDGLGGIWRGPGGKGRDTA